MVTGLTAGPVLPCGRHQAAPSSARERSYLRRRGNVARVNVVRRRAAQPAVIPARSDPLSAPVIEGAQVIRLAIVSVRTRSAPRDVGFATLLSSPNLSDSHR